MEKTDCTGKGEIKRRAYSRFRDIPTELVVRLNHGEIETTTLTEQDDSRYVQNCCRKLAQRCGQEPAGIGQGGVPGLARNLPGQQCLLLH